MTFDEHKIREIIHGKDSSENIVSIEINNDKIEIFYEEKDKPVYSRTAKNQFWIVSPYQYNSSWTRLKGNLHYKYIKYYNSVHDFYKAKRDLKETDTYSIADSKEAAMMLYGGTYFKGMKVEDVSVLSFDIETTGIPHNDTSKVLLISNTFVKNGVTTRRLFAYDDYETEMALFDDWCDWVHDINPSVITGHNIFGYDLPYMSFCAKRAGTDLYLGRDGSIIKFNKYTSKFRKDGSQDYDYTRAFIYGREIVDTMFLAIHFDFARKYDSYGLKAIIKHEGLEVANRQFYDGAKIGVNYLIPEEWVKIKQYAMHDADDAFALYKLMIPAYFYVNQSIPKSFQSINYSASGSQINALLVRSYLQDGHSLPRATQTFPFEGAISMGNPGVYKNVFKVDIASLYPSIMIQYNVYDKEKDPNAHFAKMVNYFTDERLNNKKKGKETGDRYYKELEQAQKIVINSAYGMMGASGLNFNSPVNAEFVTRTGREILQKAMNWAIDKGFKIVNADTDSISICDKDNLSMSNEYKQELVQNLNNQFPEKIRWEDDGYFPSVLILKAKNYVLYDGKKIKIKGSALKSSKLEPALKDFQKDIIDCFIFDKPQDIMRMYQKYIREVYCLKDIKPWCSKKTLTQKVMEAERTTEQKILDAVEGMDIQMGDKIHVYFTEDDKLKLADAWANDHDKTHLCERVWKTLSIFSNVLEIKDYPKYHLKKSQKELLPKLLETA